MSSAAKSPALLVPIAIGLFLLVIASVAAYLLWPRGERVGAIDLLATAPSLDVELKAGDTLSFRLDVVVGTDSSYPDSSTGRSNAVHEQLATSTVTITLARDGTPERSTVCGAYDGKATTGSSNATDVESSGLPLRCSLVAAKSGKHLVAVSVDWTPTDMRKAKLEVRRERAGD